VFARRRLHKPVPKVKGAALGVRELFEDAGVEFEKGVCSVSLLQQKLVVLFFLVGPLAEGGVTLVLLLQVLVLVFNHFIMLRANPLIGEHSKATQ
jgi:hypothetical protein